MPSLSGTGHVRTLNNFASRFMKMGLEVNVEEELKPIQT